MSQGEGMWDTNESGSDPETDDHTEGDDDEYLSRGLASLSSLEVLKIDCSCLPLYWEMEDPGYLATIVPSTVKEVTMLPYWG